ncbi:MAG TPA: hypothetical protein VFB62_10935 [Polyangiaceae bacterium]|nr:hypothetical protein [Polyangiaceae bacterium]
MMRHYLLLSLALGSAACGSSVMFETGSGGEGGTSGSVTGSGAGTTVGVGPGTGTSTVTTTTGPGTTTTGSSGTATSTGTTTTTVAATSGTGGMSSSMSATTVTTTSSGTGGNPNCPHDVCTDGPALQPSCGMCETSVCTQDPYCCQAWWDGLCIQEANQLCMANCPYCPHDMCDTGEALSPACDPCVAQVCASNPNCCSSWWGGGCIQLVGTICNIACP